jgi:hypothetical protein
LQNNNFNISGTQVWDVDIRNYFQANRHNANAVQHLQSQSWYDDAIHNPMHWNNSDQD